jgi:uncharacterized protein YaaQ
VTLTGASNTLVTASVEPVYATTNGTFTAAGNTVALTGEANQPITAQIAGAPGWNALTDQHAIVPFSHTATNLAAAQGSYTQYALQVVATMTNGNLEVWYGAILVFDDGFASGTPTAGDLVPSGAQYDSSGNYTLAGLVAGYTYYWIKGVDDATASGLTQTGSFVPAGGSVVLTGTPNSNVTAVVYLYSTSIRPLTIQAALTSGATGFNAIATLPYVPLSAVAQIMTPSGGASIDAPCDYTTLGNVGSTGIVFNFTTAIPASGYYIKVTIQ